jgi:ATP-dependent RNA helicase DDX55/SPB4
MEHQLSFIFRLKSLDIGPLANSFCLLRLPRIKEILGKTVLGFEQSERNPDEIEYLDKAREAKR